MSRLKLMTITDGVTTEITREEVTAQREGLIQLRDQALKHGMMEWAVLLSHTIATLAAVLTQMNSD